MLGSRRYSLDERNLHMLGFLPAPLRGGVILSLFVLSTLAWAVPVYALIVAKLLMPFRYLRARCVRLLMWLAEGWSMTNVRAIQRFLRIHWDIRGAEHLDRHGTYLVLPNHQSWVDILVLQRSFGRQLPFFKFFLKQELIWIPILGPVWWALEYPFMKRYSTSKLKRHPELRSKDMETTRRICERSGDHPLALLNFPEGTRFTDAKHASTRSPYQHLLRPKAGGLALTLGAMGEKLTTLLDVTIVYPDGVHGMWGFLCGRISRIIVDVRRLSVPNEILAGDYQNDPAFRRRFQRWLTTLWAEKDALIERMLAEADTLAQSTGEHPAR